MRTPPAGALLIDWGGVLTSSPSEALAAFARREGLAANELTRQMRRGGTLYEPFVALELGHITDEEFEARFAAGLGLEPDGAVGLRERLFQTMRPDQLMRAAVARVRRSGARVGLLSNSVGTGGYEQDVVDELFDLCVISREVGARKPERVIYEIALDRVGVGPEEVVFVDDLDANLSPARQLGMVTVLHRDAVATIEELAHLFPAASLTELC